MEYIKQVDSCLLAKVLSLNCVNFDYYGSSFSEKNIRLSSNKDGGTKEGSGRVALFRASNNPRCYTLECNYHSGRIINDIARCQINETDQEIYNSYVYQHGPPPYDILLFEDVGKAMGVSFLDLIEKNMHSRLDSAL